MINKDLKRLSRRELVDVIYQMKKNEEQLQEKIASLEEALEEKRIRLSSAGSIAEAAVDITNVFSAAQSTADIYLQEIQTMRENADKECKRMIEDAKVKVEKILSAGNKQKEYMDAHYRNDYKKWRDLQADIERLEEKKRELSED
ncbi:MAG: hypothetical protein IKT34_02090 [Clostridia bacterium]|nr:hypothetical protein [Clostridia bacterium]